MSATTLQKWFHEDATTYEIGVDEVGRGPLFGRVYTAAVVLPKGDDSTFDFSLMKDSKRFHSTKKIEQVAEYIRVNAVAWAVTYEDETTIDSMNILQATQSSMHASIHEVMRKLGETRNYYLLIDGNYFKPITKYDAIEKKFVNIPYSTVEQGDNKLAAIAAASILAKVARDAYIHDLCAEHPELSAHYGIDKNKGYGTRQHLAGIEAHGITQWHRKSFKRIGKPRFPL